MCLEALVSLLVATCEPIELPMLQLNVPKSGRSIESAWLDDPELARVRGGAGLSVRIGEDGIIRLVQDGNTRDMAFVVPFASGQMDAWWTEVGSAYIALSLSQP